VIVETRLEGMLDTPAWVRRKRRETLNILINGALQMAKSGLVLNDTRDGTCIAITGMNRRCVMPADGSDGLCILHRPDDAPSTPSAPPPVARRSPSPAKAVTPPAKPRRKPRKAARASVAPRRTPEVRPAPKPHPERPALPDELRCTALNRRGLRCKLEAIANRRCLVHSGAR